MSSIQKKLLELDKLSIIFEGNTGHNPTFFKFGPFCVMWLCLVKINSCCIFVQLVKNKFIGILLGPQDICIII